MAVTKGLIWNKSLKRCIQAKPTSTYLPLMQATSPLSGICSLQKVTWAFFSSAQTATARKWSLGVWPMVSLWTWRCYPAATGGGREVGSYSEHGGPSIGNSHLPLLNPYSFPNPAALMPSLWPERTEWRLSPEHRLIFLWTPHQLQPHPHEVTHTPVTRHLPSPLATDTPKPGQCSWWLHFTFKVTACCFNI